MGVVQFAQIPEAETAIGKINKFPRARKFTNEYIAKFQGYMYGGRPLGMFPSYKSVFCITYSFVLDVRFNDRWHTFSPDAAKGGQVAPAAAEPVA